MAEVQKRAAKKVTVDYKKGKIYKVVNDANDLIYVGSTTQELSKRMSSHRTLSKVRPSKFYTAMREIGYDHFRIILIENFACGSKAELEAREYEIMKTFSKDKTYNSIIDGKFCAESKEKMREAHTGRVGRLNNAFQRGSLCCQPKWNRFCFEWRSDGTKYSKTFAFGTKRTREQAYLACIDKQNEIFPLTHEEYLSELPFAHD